MLITFRFNFKDNQYNVTDKIMIIKPMIEVQRRMAKRSVMAPARADRFGLSFCGDILYARRYGSVGDGFCL